MEIIRPMQLGFNQRVLEQDRRFYFTVSATLGINLASGKEQVDALYLKDAFEGNPDDPPLLDPGFPKPCGEFLVSGSFHAPGKVPVRGGAVRARVGDIEKELFIFGPRQWKNGFPTEPEKVTTLPLIYKNAFGGKEYDLNPDGRGFKDGLLPQVEDPRHLVGSQKDTPVPASFSAMDMMDPRRKPYMGTYDDDYREKYFPGHPEDMDWKLFLLTPEDQRSPGFFTGNETFALQNMHPYIPLIEGQFPGLHARCFIKKKTRTDTPFGEMPLNLDTIWFFPEKLLGLLFFRGVTEVEDDEGDEISHILCAYEYRDQPPRSISHYQTALEKRIENKDPLSMLLVTSDLIPGDHKNALELLMQSGQDVKPGESPLGQNIEAKTQAMLKAADEKIEAAVSKAEKKMDDMDLPDETAKHVPDDARANLPGKGSKISIREMVGKKSESKPDRDIEALYRKMEAILPGVTAGDVNKLDLKQFSFEKMDRIMEAAQDFSDKKQADTQKQIDQTLDSAQKDMRKQSAVLDEQIEQLKKVSETSGTDTTQQIQKLETAKSRLEEGMGRMKMSDSVPLEKQPLPRIDLEPVWEQLDQAPSFPPEIISAIQHLQAQKAAGADDETTRSLEKQIRAAEENYKNQLKKARSDMEEQLAPAKNSFRDGYLLGAHFMVAGLPPHKESVKAVRAAFLEALSKGEAVSGGDWACLDLSGQNLEGVDLSGSFLEQVDFKGANLKGANLKKANLARACLDGADLSGTDLTEANIGAVSGAGANFSNARMIDTRLSNSRFDKAVFNGATMESVEFMDVNLSGADLSGVSVKTVFFVNTQMSDTQITGADMELSAFIKPLIRDVDFSRTVFNRCVFVDPKFNRTRFDHCDLSNSVFVATSQNDSSMAGLTFRQGKLFQTNLMKLDLKHTDFSGADLTKAFFWESDLSGADLSNTRARETQFRKAKLTNAVLDNMNMPQGSLAKAHLVGASFKGANLFQADVLRSTITNTNFDRANLDFTLIENWRPK